MKRFISLLLILAMAFTAASAAAEGQRCEINAVIQAGDQEFTANLNILPGEDRYYFTSSLIPDLCVQLAEINPEQTTAALAELIRNLGDERIAEIIRKSTEEWIAFLQPETRTGSYSGDAFEQASEMQYVRFSYGDLTLLGRRIRKALQARGISAELLESDWSALFTPERNLWFDLKIFDGGKYASLGVLDGENTVATVSANLADPDCLLLITGRGFGGKNYYSRLLAEKKEGRLDVTEKLYADDLKAGYPGLKENSLVYTLNSTVEWDGETVQCSAFLFPAKTEMTSIAASGTLRNAETGRVFEGEVHFSGYDGFRVKVTADLKENGTEALPGRVIDLDQADETELIGLGAEIGMGMLPILIQCIGALPPEYAGPVENFMNQ